jgi:hypothetical protein
LRPQALRARKTRVKHRSHSQLRRKYFYLLSIFHIMRKKIFIGISAVAVGTIAAVNVNYALQGNKNLSELALANVEALAEENSETPTYTCPGGGTECVRVIRGSKTHIFYKGN